MNPDKDQIVEIGEANFEREVLQAKLPVLVAFLAPWSRPCQTVRTILIELAAACAGTVNVFVVNADEHPDLGFWYEIHSVPTMLYFADGHLRARLVGTASKEVMLSRLQHISRGGVHKSAQPGTRKGTS